MIESIINNHRLINLVYYCFKEYNKFWSKFIMATYFLYVAIICYTIFQAFFTFNLFTVRIIMIIMTIQASYLITKISMVASNMSDEVSLSLKLLDLFN